MTKQEFIRILSRAIALYFAAWALAECTYLPQYLLSLTHHLSYRVELNFEYWSSYYILETASLVLRIAALSLASLYFWKAGPKVMALFSANEEASNQTSDGIET